MYLLFVPFDGQFLCDTSLSPMVRYCQPEVNLNVPSANPELSKVAACEPEVGQTIALMPGVGENRALNASPATRVLAV